MRYAISAKAKSSSATSASASSKRAADDPDEQVWFKTQSSSSDDLEMPPAVLTFEDPPPPGPPPGPPPPKKKAMPTTPKSHGAVPVSKSTTMPKSHGAANPSSNADAASASNVGENAAPSSNTAPSIDHSDDPMLPEDRDRLDPKTKDFWHALQPASGARVGDVPCAVMILGSNIS